MSIILFRIDDRLIHGQVVEGWLKEIGAEIIVVANDIVACDEMQKALMTLAIPSDVDVYIERIDTAIEQYKQGYFDKNKTLVLVSCPKDAFQLIEGGLKINSINIGGMHFSEGKKQILETISVSKDDVEYLRALSNKGLQLESRTLPEAERIDVAKELKKQGL
ncbi:MAG: PTS sugar transporter subunit IIB [Elusimicrobiota bacterium]